MPSSHRKSPVLESLVELFYGTLADLGEFEEVSPENTPPPYNQLLAHDQHMTVTVEQFHNSPVDIKVLDIHNGKTHYSRKILLTRKSDGRVVQFGLVRLCLDFLAPDVRNKIEQQQTPLGRILIQHDVMRDVQLISIWKVKLAEELQNLFDLDTAGETYGRTALIYCNGVPAIELLEIVSPA